jgi:hypothetical protein
VYAGHHASSTEDKETTAQLKLKLDPAYGKDRINTVNVGAFFGGSQDEIISSKNWEDTCETRCIYFIAEEKVQECPKISVKIGEIEVLAILDTGCELTIMNQSLYEKIQQKGSQYLELPAQHLTLVSAFNDKGKRVKKQIFVPVKLGNFVIDQVFIISPQLVTAAILGVDFFINTRATINFPEQCATFKIDNETTKQLFNDAKGNDTVGNKRDTPEINSQEVYQVSAGIYRTGVLASPIVKDREIKTKKEDADLAQQIGCKTVSHCLQKTKGNYYSSTNSGKVASDGREITLSKMRDKVGEYEDLSEDQRSRLLSVLTKYQSHLTKQPGRCKGFEYHFNIVGNVPKSNSSRTVPFALRDEVRSQIETMIEDGILEESYSDYTNPLTLVHRENKPVRICVDARGVNKHMTPDRVKVAPMKELLQQFHGSRYITSVDLSSAFHQVVLAKSSRKWTALNFENRLYQFARVPYGYKNSLAAFIRALQKVLGDEKNVITYVDDILIHSSEFSAHLATLDSVLNKLTSAGFTINASKCHFCRREIKFLGYIISESTLRPDPQRIEAILSYPTPRNQKQLRQFLGVCNFHHQFIVNYAEYASPLLTLLRKGSKWSWPPEMHKAFEELRAKFAHSIYLVQPDDSQDYTINTDASAKAIGAVLLQKDQEGRTNIVSTASRALVPAERRYTTCEQELLAIVYALRKFKIYIYGHRITLNTDHKALTFLKKCVVSSTRVARWMLEIEQWDIEIQHIKGSENTLADILSRNPPNDPSADTLDLRQRGHIMVHAIDLKIDKSIKKEFRDLAIIQDTDPRLQAIKERVKIDPTVGTKHRVDNGVLYCQVDREGQEWRIMLPECLEQRVIKCVHTSLGHLGSDKSYAEITGTFYCRNLGRKLRKFIAACDICQRSKHLNKAYDVIEKHHVPKHPGELCAVDLYGGLPTSRGNVRFMFVCYDMFTKHVKLYALKSATTQACLNKLLNHYFSNVIKPEIVLSDNGSQFRSPAWTKRLKEQVYAPGSHPFGTQRVILAKG